MPRCWDFTVFFTSDQNFAENFFGYRPRDRWFIHVYINTYWVKTQWKDPSGVNESFFHWVWCNACVIVVFHIFCCFLMLVSRYLCRHTLAKLVRYDEHWAGTTYSQLFVYARVIVFMLLRINNFAYKKCSSKISQHRLNYMRFSDFSIIKNCVPIRRVFWISRIITLLLSMFEVSFIVE